MAAEAPAIPWDHPAVESFATESRRRGRLCVGDLDAVARAASLSGEQLCEIQRVLRDEGLEIDDDCGKERVPVTRYRPQQLTEYTGDGLQQFLNEAGREPLLTPDEEKDLARRIERGDLEAKDRMVRANLRLVVSIARRYQGLGEAVPARPHPGGHARADPRGRRSSTGARASASRPTPRCGSARPSSGPSTSAGGPSACPAGWPSSSAGPRRPSAASSPSSATRRRSRRPPRPPT